MVGEPFTFSGEVRKGWDRYRRLAPWKQAGLAVMTAAVLAWLALSPFVHLGPDWLYAY